MRLLARSVAGRTFEGTGQKHRRDQATGTAHGVAPAGKRGDGQCGRRIGRRAGPGHLAARPDRRQRAPFKVAMPARALPGDTGLACRSPVEQSACCRAGDYGPEGPGAGSPPAMSDAPGLWIPPRPHPNSDVPASRSTQSSAMPACFLTAAVSASPRAVLGFMVRCDKRLTGC